jgi:hypothetical protein
MPRYGIPDLDARVAYLESLMAAQKQAEEEQQTQPQVENQEEAAVVNPQPQMQQFSMFQIPENLIHHAVQESPKEEEITAESVAEVQEEEKEEKSQKRVSRRRKKTDAESEQSETTTTVPPAAFDFPVSETTNTTAEPVASDTTFESAENE